LTSKDGYKPGYKQFIEECLSIVDKQGELVDFTLNDIQNRYLIDGTGRDIILKARQQGFSSLILAIFTADFLLKQNTRNVIVADISDNAMELLDRVKTYLESYTEHTGVPVDLKYNSKYELYNNTTKSRYTIGTADKTDFGRSKTITNLHFSEFAFYRDPEKLLAGAMQAVVPQGRAIIETTANGFNYFKQYWTESELGNTGFKPLFYKASDFYSPDVLQQKQRELGRLYKQEYPDSPMEAFVTSGDSYFDKDSLAAYMEFTQNVQEI
jgi:hypothetical protein